VATVVHETDAALAFGTVAVLVVSIVVLVILFVVFRSIRDALVKWYYRRKYAAEFRRRDQ
jgi:hypothetical protein